MDNDDKLVDELRAVKMLLILQSLALGCQQKQIAAALGVSDATLSRMLPKGFSREIAKSVDRRLSGEAT
jgi:DNA-binding transcriptional regulator LsrR (DeoR family)